MSGLNDREKALEDKYFFDSERSFKIRAHRNKLLATWAAALIGRSDTEAYINEVIEAGMAASGDENIIQKVLADLQAAGQSWSDAALRQKMQELMFEAAEQLESGSA